MLMSGFSTTDSSCSLCSPAPSQRRGPMAASASLQLWIQQRQLQSTQTGEGTRTGCDVYRGSVWLINPPGVTSSHLPGYRVCARTETCSCSARAHDIILLVLSLREIPALTWTRLDICKFFNPLQLPRGRDGEREVLTGAYGREGHAGSVFPTLHAATGSR